jgi:hypothetical protein
MTKILAFDMGIRNLAYCVVDMSGTDFSVLDWDNYDLLAGSDSQSASRCVCGGPPSWSDISGGMWCKKCAKSGKTLLKGLPNDVVMNVKGLKLFVEKMGWAVPKKAKKEDYLDLIKKAYLMPYTKPKGTMKTELSVLLIAIEKFLDGRLLAFSETSVIRIENQPVFDAPTMKSVQIILFTLLTHRLRKEHGWKGQVVFVHASKKTEEAQEAVDDAGGNYKARKDAAETLVVQKLKDEKHKKWLDYFNAKKKKSDLADALLMCLRLDK